MSNKLSKEICQIDEYGTKVYYNAYGQIHREDGPAIEYLNGDKEWYLNGMEHTEQEFNNFFLKKRLKRILE